MGIITPNYIVSFSSLLPDDTLISHRSDYQTEMAGSLFSLTYGVSVTSSKTSHTQFISIKQASMVSQAAFDQACLRAFGSWYYRKPKEARAVWRESISFRSKQYVRIAVHQERAPSINMWSKFGNDSISFRRVTETANFAKFSKHAGSSFPKTWANATDIEKLNIFESAKCYFKA